MWLNCTKAPIHVQLIRRHLDAETEAEVEAKADATRPLLKRRVLSAFMTLFLSAFGGYFCSCFLLFRLLWSHTSTFTSTDFAPYEKISAAASASSAAASVGVAANLVKAAAGRIDTLLRLGKFVVVVVTVVAGIFVVAALALCTFESPFGCQKR